MQKNVILNKIIFTFVMLLTLIKTLKQNVYEYSQLFENYYYYYGN